MLTYVSTYAYYSCMAKYIFFAIIVPTITSLDSKIKVTWADSILNKVFYLFSFLAGGRRKIYLLIWNMIASARKSHI